MIKELITEWRTQATDRLRDPLLGAFSGVWLVTNWRLVGVFLFSDKPIEERIEFIEEFYLDVSTLLIYPLLIAVLLVLFIPWVSWLIQYPQELAFLKRKKHKLEMDTEYLKASVGRAEAQAELNQILAKDQITQRQRDELDTMKRQFEEQQERASAKIAATEAELEQKNREFEQKKEGDIAEAEKARLEIEKVRDRLEKEQQQAIKERNLEHEKLRKAQEEFEARLNSKESKLIKSTGVDLESVLLSRSYRLYHNPSAGPERSKTITFAPNGKILEGGNKFEYSWKIVDGKLELIQSDGHTHSRFYYLPDSEIFVHTGDSDTLSARGQYIVPERA